MQAAGRGSCDQSALPAKKPYTMTLLLATSSLSALYAEGMGFSTRGGMDRMRVEGMVMRFRTAMILFGLLAGAAALAAPQTPKAVATRDPELIDAQGYQKLIQRYRGKPLLVTFWATWCEPCRDEYPMLNELAKQYAPQGLKVVGVNYDQDGDLILMRRFITRYKPVFPNYRKKPDEAEESFRQAVRPGWNGALPASFFYAQDGRQVAQFVGEQTREEYDGAIRSLLGSGTN